MKGNGCAALNLLRLEGLLVRIICWNMQKLELEEHENGGRACTKLLTAHLLKSILIHSTGTSDAQGTSCAFTADIAQTTIKIELYDHLSLDAWKAYTKVDCPTAVALAGVGDQALRVDKPVVIDAWKKGDRSCRLILLAIDEQPKLTDYAHEVRITLMQRFDLRTGHVVDPLS